ncbi:MAG: VIT1/CCC1 transporter family protein [Candidatus Magasanikbacteria bacterium]|nr:VIT1/CCC1 transporter family protein [Candidatus Magasanikbacteria bacterium]
MADIPYNPNFIHHNESIALSAMRELVFGLEDGMVSTMGSITGIATATQSSFLIILSGSVIIAVESISMAVGSYLSSKSEHALEERKLFEERQEISQNLTEETKEMQELFIEDGWPDELAGRMALVAAQDKELMLKEMAYRELKICVDKSRSPVRNGAVMLVAYIIGGFVPLFPYFLFNNIGQGVIVSIAGTLAGLFALGGFTARYSNRSWYSAGFEMLGLAGLAAFVGYGAGQIIDKWWK